MFGGDSILRPSSALTATVAVSFIALLSVALAMPALAKVIHVGRGRGCPESMQPESIQKGLDDAVSGGRLEKSSGTYSENIVWPDDLEDFTLIGISGPESTIIDGGGLGPVISLIGRLDSTAVLDRNIVITGFTIRNGKAQSGGGIFCQNASPTIMNNIIQGDTASYCGGGIYADANSHPVIIDNEIVDNKAEWGGGICSDDVSCQTTIFANVIHRNLANSGGGGIWGNNSLIKGNRITGNSAAWGGGVGCEWGDAAIIDSNWIKENSAMEGGGIFCQWCFLPSHALIRRNVIANNLAVYGGAIEFWLSCPEIIGNTIAGNISPSSSMGGIYNYGSQSIICNNAFFDNCGALYLDATATIGENNIYFNTYQPTDWDLRNYTGYSIDAENNWWGMTDSLAIDSLIYDDDENSAYGAVDFIPYLTSANPDAPGEPGVVTRVVLKADDSYTDDLIGEVAIDDPLYIQLEGNTWNDTLVDVALVKIISSWDRYGIATALIETSETAGIYRGRAFVAETSSDDPYDSIGVTAGEWIMIMSNVGLAWCTVLVSDPIHVQENIPDGSLPETFNLSQNYPNPFNPVTVIKYALPTDSPVKLEIYNILGQKVATLVDGEKRAGYKAVSWDAGSLSSGIYFYRLQAGDFVQTRKMVLLK